MYSTFVILVIAFVCRCVFRVCVCPCSPNTQSGILGIDSA